LRLHHAPHDEATMPQPPVKLARPPGPLVFIGGGAITQGTLPLALRHLAIEPRDITVVTADARGRDEAAALGVHFVERALAAANLHEVLRPLLRPGSFIVNLSVDVSSVALIELGRACAAMYIDTCIEPWAGAYTDPRSSAAARSNYALREQALALRAKYPRGHTALLAHGANPGLVSYFVKQALLDLQRDIEGPTTVPTNRDGWARLAMQLGVRTIHIAERDTQSPLRAKQRGEFVNTWSCDGFVSEGLQPSELGWGTHERALPADGHEHDSGCRAAIYLARPGASVRVRSWTPQEGPYHGFLITHNEAISIADHFTVRDGERVTYRPTCHYAYHPCDAAVLSLHELAGRNWRLQPRLRVIRDDIVDGSDELGVLLAGHARNAYWYGSQLSIDEARRLAPYNSATSLQVCAAVLAGIVWAIEHPRAGIVEADDMDFTRALEVARPYLGHVAGHYTDWTPLAGRGTLFPEETDASDPWQFCNVRVT
jgi:homospermidine synthase